MSSERDQKGELFNTDIVEWLNDCPTHKLEIDHIDEYGLSLRVRFNNKEG